MSGSPAGESVTPFKFEHRDGGGRHLRHDTLDSMDVGWVGKNYRRDGRELLDLAAAELQVFTGSPTISAPSGW